VSGSFHYIRVTVVTVIDKLETASGLGEVGGEPLLHRWL